MNSKAQRQKPQGVAPTVNENISSLSIDPCENLLGKTKWRIPAPRIKRKIKNISVTPTIDSYREEIKFELLDFIPLNPNSDANNIFIMDQLCSKVGVRGALGVTDPILECVITITDMGAMPPLHKLTSKNVIPWMPTLHLLMAVLSLIMAILKQVDSHNYSELLKIFGYNSPFSQASLFDVNDTHKVYQSIYL
jgi:hypothetical protein